MRKIFLSGFPEGAERIGTSLSMLSKNGTVTYFLGSDNYFSHKDDDNAARRFTLTSLMANKHVRATDLERSSLALPHRTLMNWMAQYRDHGGGSFFTSNRPRSNPRVMTDEKAAECAHLLAGGHCPAEVARRTKIGGSTLRKAIGRGQISLPNPTTTTLTMSSQVSASSKASRSRDDALAATGIGTACTRADERIFAAFGLVQSAATRFEACSDVSLGGLLAGLPALCANGLFSGIGHYLKLPAGFYSCLHILLTLGFMALSRIRRPEGLRHIPPGEMGKVIGLDRVPEVRTLRDKITIMASTGNPGAWMKELAKTWMGVDPEEAGYLYIDGHVRVYHGSKAVLPKRFISRQRLCLRGTTDYWINDALGRPFFVVSKAVSSGLAEVILNDIVPELLSAVPNQPTNEQLAANPRLHRLIVVFDREGSTGSLLEPLWEKRIGAITYRKNVKDLWPDNEFKTTKVVLPDGTHDTLKLALRDTPLSKTSALIVKEVRILTNSGHQTAIISTAHLLDALTIAGRMFSRWCQENFFAYMMQHYDIDGLLQYGAEDLPGTLQVVNPAFRQLDKAVSKTRHQLRKLQAVMGASPTDMDEATIQKQAQTLVEIEAIKADLNELKSQRKSTARKVPLDSLPVDERPTQLMPLNKQLTDTVKMIAYRAETALVSILRQHLAKEDEARALIRELFVSSAELIPDESSKTLTVKIHRMASPVHDRAISALLEELNRLNFCHPETGDRFIYALV
jgi:hypothetical protein